MFRACALPMLLSVALTLAFAPAAAEPVRAKIETGVLAGDSHDGVEAFKGIPFAAPPIGPLRWRLPQPAAAWGGERPALDFGHSCPQPRLPAHLAPGPAEQASEDCLTLNVWAPAGAHDGLPVMVWIHGGGNVNGGSGDVFYDGSAFARDGVVLVSINYRLGALGFLVLPALSGPAGDKAEANFGLWDQVAALQWVRRNISAFGGDPAKVTVFGESAGGEDIRALLTAPPARGLFRAAIIESGGGGWSTDTLAQAEEEAEAFAAGLGVAQGPGMGQALRALPADKLAAAAEHDFGPVVDGRLLAEDPLQAMAAGRMAQVPLLIGTNSGEGSVLGRDPSSPQASDRLDAADVAALKAAYGAQAATDAGFARALFRDSYFTGPSRYIAEQWAAHGRPAYLYRFDYVLGALRPRRGDMAFHGSEIPFVFGAWPQDAMSAADETVEAAMHRCWVSFAKTLAPDCGSGWSAFDDRHWMVFDAAPSMRPIAPLPALDLIARKLGPAKG